MEMLKMEGFFMIRDLHHQGLNISQISREIGLHRHTVRKYITAQTTPTRKKRREQPSILDPFKEYVQQRINEYPLTGSRIFRELKEQGFTRQCTTVKNYIQMTAKHDSSGTWHRRRSWSRAYPPRLPQRTRRH